MGCTAAFVELLEAGLNLVQLPALRLDKRGNCFCGQKRLRAAGAPGQHLEPLLRTDIDAHGQCGRHLCWCVWTCTHSTTDSAPRSVRNERTHLAVTMPVCEWRRGSRRRTRRARYRVAGG